MIALGRLDDIRGFALAGVEIARCESVVEGSALVNTLAADPSVGVVVVPAWLGSGAASSIGRVREQRRGPVVVVLPDTDSDR
jgi:vacuolar-type H+-ATPase subunit F/Vma7